jgi:Domain of unknown function (DUF4375)
MTTKASSPKKRPRTESFISYSGETAAELFSYPPSGQYDVLVQAFREGIQRKATRKGDDALTTEEEAILAVGALFEEVNNGGYDQFFRNRSRTFVPMIVDSLVLIKLQAQAKVTQRAVEALHLRTNNVRAIKGAMSKESKARDDVLEECNRSFYEIQRGAARKIYLFLKANRSHIVF